MQATTIPLSKSKVLFLLVVSIVFLLLGYWLYGLDAAEIEARRRYNSPAFVHSIGIAGFIMGVLGSIVAVRKFFDSTPGLVLDEQGLTDNSSAFSAGFIPWSEIAGIEVRQIQRQRILYILLADPEAYIAKFSPMKQKLMRLNMKMAPSPVAVISNSLSVSFDELLELAAKYFEASRSDKTVDAPAPDHQ